MPTDLLQIAINLASIERIIRISAIETNVSSQILKRLARKSASHRMKFGNKILNAIAAATPYALTFV